MSEIYDMCIDDRFELIDKAKRKLFECTNIESNPEEVSVIDSILFRCWQMGWLDKLRDDDSRYSELFGTPERTARTMADLQTCSLGFDLECDECAVYSLCQSGARNDRDKLLEWLRGDA